MVQAAPDISPLPALPPKVCLSVLCFLSICLSVCLSVFLSVCPSVCLSLSLSLSLTSWSWVPCDRGVAVVDLHPSSSWTTLGNDSNNGRCCSHHHCCHSLYHQLQFVPLCKKVEMICSKRSLGHDSTLSPSIPCKQSVGVLFIWLPSLPDIDNTKGRCPVLLPARRV